MQLRPYQTTARHWVNRQLNSSRNPLLVMPTGTGKTKTTVMIIKDRISLNKKILVLTHQMEIFNQWLNDCTIEKLNPGYINDDGIIGRGRNVYICMVQSLENILTYIPEKFYKSFSEIIIDEAHHSSATTWQNIFNHFQHCKLLGLTATPYRMDNKPLIDFFDIMYEPIKMSEAIAAGYLCKPIVIIPDEYKDLIPDINILSDENFNYEDQGKKIQDKKIIGDMVETYRNIFNGLTVLIPCSTSEHARAVKEMYINDGWIVEFIHSGKSKTERKDIVKDVKSGKINILITVGIGVEGMDIPGLYGLIWLRFTQSLTIYMQFNGRAMRPMEGKKNFIMIDPVGNSVIHGRPDIDRKWSLTTNYIPGQDIEDAPISRICPVCSVVNSQLNSNCWICNYDFSNGTLDGVIVDKKKRRLPKMIDGNLVFLDDYEFEKYEEKIIKKIVDKNDNKNYSDNINGEIKTLSMAEKMKILNKDLTGLKLNSKFKEGLKWL